MTELAERHPNLITWLVLAVGMLLVLAWSAREVVLSASQWFWLAVATTLLAGLCAWIISWEADEPDEVDDTSDVTAADMGDDAEAGDAVVEEAGDAAAAEEPADETADETADEDEPGDA